MMNVSDLNKVNGNYYGYYGYQSKVNHNANAVNQSIFAQNAMNEVSFKGNPVNVSVFKSVMLPMLAAGFAVITSIFKKNKSADTCTQMMPEKFEAVKSSPSTYREKLSTPDYSHTRENFPSDAHQSTSKSGKATAYTTDGKEDGIVYRDSEGKLRVPNKWDPEHPYEVSDGTAGKPASVIMIYDEEGGDFAVGDPDTIASTYKNPSTGELDPLYDTPAGKEYAFEIHKDEVPSAYKMVPDGTEIQTKEGSRVVQKNEVVVYDTDGDPYVMPLKNFLKRQAPMTGDDDSKAVYEKLQAAQKDGTDIPAELMSADGNATSPNAKTYYAAQLNRHKNAKNSSADESKFLILGQSPFDVKTVIPAEFFGHLNKTSQDAPSVQEVNALLADYKNGKLGENEFTEKLDEVIKLLKEIPKINCDCDDEGTNHEGVINIID